MASQGLAADLPYIKTDKELADFAEWLEKFLNSEEFRQFAEDFPISRKP
ncbi:MAG: hypothetical protein JJ876_14440 [Muricauda sp.]|nr:hypothetical protein [Allomuricauda sp.]MBO6830747.1 hypothetical protein [Allomuricauda sp.]